MGRYRDDQGKTADKYQFASVKDTGHNAHDRQHAGNFNPRHPPIPVRVSQPEPPTVVVGVPSQPEPPIGKPVPDPISTWAALGLAMLALMVLKRRR